MQMRNHFTYVINFRYLILKETMFDPRGCLGFCLIFMIDRKPFITRCGDAVKLIEANTLVLNISSNVYLH
jgi:hypothetical protein